MFESMKSFAESLDAKSLGLGAVVGAVVAGGLVYVFGSRSTATAEPAVDDIPATQDTVETATDADVAEATADDAEAA